MPVSGPQRRTFQCGRGERNDAPLHPPLLFTSSHPIWDAHWERGSVPTDVSVSGEDRRDSDLNWARAGTRNEILYLKLWIWR